MLVVALSIRSSVLLSRSCVLSPPSQLGTFWGLPQHGSERDRHEPGALPSSALPGAQPHPSLHADRCQPPHQKVCCCHKLSRLQLFFYFTVVLPRPPAELPVLDHMNCTISSHFGFSDDGSPAAITSLIICMFEVIRTVVFETWWNRAGHVEQRLNI